MLPRMERRDPPLASFLLLELEKALVRRSPARALREMHTGLPHRLRKVAKISSSTICPVKLEPAKATALSTGNRVPRTMEIPVKGKAKTLPPAKINRGCKTQPEVEKQPLARQSPRPSSSSSKAALEEPQPVMSDPRMLVRFRRTLKQTRRLPAPRSHSIHPT